MKICNVCGRLLSLDEFPKDKNNKDGHKNKCKKCTAEYNRKYNKQQKEKYLKLKETIISPEKSQHLLGGYKVYILNHASKGERKFNVVSTTGEVFNTDNREKFFEFLRGKV